jgi:hypothetical protein
VYLKFELDETIERCHEKLGHEEGILVVCSVEARMDTGSMASKINDKSKAFA